MGASPGHTTVLYKSRSEWLRAMQVRDSSEEAASEEGSLEDEVPEYAEVGRALDGIQARLYNHLHAKENML